MGIEIFTFGDIGIKKIRFYCYKSLFLKKDVDVGKILVSESICFSKENYMDFNDYLHNDFKVRPSHVMILKTSVYVKSYDGQTKLVYFLIEDNDLLDKYNTIWDKVISDIKKKFDSEPVYNKKFLKTEKKSHGDEVTDFLNILRWILIILA